MTEHTEREAGGPVAREDAAGHMIAEYDDDQVNIGTEVGHNLKSLRRGVSDFLAG